MPVYTYRCDHCGVQFDQYQKVDEEHLKTCPECGEPALRKLYRPVGIVFKGSGFYSTDNRSPSGQSSMKKTEEAEKPKKAESPKNNSKAKASKSDQD